MARAAQYNQGQVTIELDGEIVQNFTECRILSNEAGSTMVVGASSSYMNFATNKTGTFELDLEPISTTIDQIYSLWDNQNNGFARLFDIIVHTGVQEFHKLSRCGLITPGNITTGGAEQGILTAKFNVLEINFDGANQ